MRIGLPTNLLVVLVDARRGRSTPVSLFQSEDIEVRLREPPREGAARGTGADDQNVYFVRFSCDGSYPVMAALV